LAWIAVPVGTLFFGAIGLGIGALFPKKRRIELTPTISYRDGTTQAGAMVSVNF